MSKPLLPLPRLEAVNGWGESWRTAGYVYRPSTIAGITAVFDEARARNLTVALRGAGRSYGDAATGAEQTVLDLSRLTRILDWDPQTGVLQVEPGVTLQEVWEYGLGDGWWPPVVSGTQTVTLGGAASMNIHGKNHYKQGTLGEHILSFDLLLPSGESRTCTPTENRDLFYAAIGGFGMLGVFTSLTLQMQKVHSGLLNVGQVSADNLAEMFTKFDRLEAGSDFLVGWIDPFATGDRFGRGLILAASHLGDGDDTRAVQTLRVESQTLPDTLLGIIPKALLWRFMRPLVNDTGMRLLSAVRYAAGKRQNGQVRRETHAAYHFLLDYVPHWKRAYGPGGLMQYQAFVPRETAHATFAAQLRLCQQHGLLPYLTVFKRHRPDPFLMSYAGDGYSLALDFKVTPERRAALWQLAARMDRLIVDAGGRFYFAKDSTLHASRLGSYLGEARVQQFLALKAACDPENLLQTDLYRRLFPAIS